MARISLLSASYSARSLIASAQRCVNLYPEANPPDAAAPTTFYSTPGRTLWSTLPGAGGVRCLYEASNGDLYGVRGAELYRYDGAAWILTAALVSSTGPVYAADNGIDAVFTDGTLTAPTVKLATHVVGYMAGPGWYGSDFVDFLNGFFIFNRPGTQQFYISGALDTTLDALDFASAESVPDNLVRHLKDHNDLILFGAKSTEVFSFGGAADFPLERISGATMEVGCAAKHSPCRMDNSVFWLGADERGDAMVWKMQGYQPQRISTHALEGEMRAYARIDDAQGFSYQMDGHSWYQLTFPSEGKTWVYDAATAQWHERAWRTPANQLTRVRDNCHVFHQRQHLVGDWENGNVYRLDLDAYTDDGQPIPRIKAFQHMTADGARQCFDKLTLDMEAGISPTGTDAQIYLRWSDDGGKTWSNMLTTSLGTTGRYKHKPTFNRLGMGRDRVFEVSTTANAKIVLQGAFLDARRGTS
jgi:hypothetical protein